jgi:hypothetical protein
MLLQAAAAEGQSPETTAKATLKEHEQQEKLALKVSPDGLVQAVYVLIHHANTTVLLGSGVLNQLSLC